MAKKIKVTKVNKEKKEITVGECVDFTPIPIISPPIWVGEMYTLDELLGITEELTKEELEKKYPKGSA